MENGKIFEISAIGVHEDRFKRKSSKETKGSFEHRQLFMAETADRSRQSALDLFEKELPQGFSEETVIRILALRITEYVKTEMELSKLKVDNPMVYSVKVALDENSTYTVPAYSLEEAKKEAIDTFKEKKSISDVKISMATKLYAQRSWVENLKEPIIFYGSIPMPKAAQIHRITRIFFERYGQEIDALVTLDDIVTPGLTFSENLERVRQEVGYPLDDE